MGITNHCHPRDLRTLSGRAKTMKIATNTERREKGQLQLRVHLQQMRHPEITGAVQSWSAGIVARKGIR